jgi:colanic acid/amylovoran biosynthesis glycosyltransferase
MAAALKLRAWSPQIVHAHFGTRGWESMTMKRWLKVPLVTSFYGYDAWLLPKSQPVWRERYHELFAEGDVFLVEGPAMATRLVELGCPKEKISIQRIGVNLDSLPFEAKQFSGDLKIVMVGRFVEKKGFIDGLRACAVARSRGVGLSVTIVGDSYADDPVGKQIKRELEEIANRPELAGAVHFAGFLPLDQTRNVLRTHNVLVCPSRHAANGDAEGGSPVALTEAMALGLLCIGTRHCDIPEIILDNQTGYLCEEGNFTAIADILTALGKDSNRLALLTRAGRKHVEEKFSLLIQLNGLHAVYKTTLSI